MKCNAPVFSLVKLFLANLKCWFGSVNANMTIASQLDRYTNIQISLIWWMKALITPSEEQKVQLSKDCRILLSKRNKRFLSKSAFMLYFCVRLLPSRLFQLKSLLLLCLTFTSTCDGTIAFKRDRLFILCDHWLSFLSKCMVPITNGFSQ
jgi:hypothetical protein